MPTAEIIIIGTEIVLGEIVDTNTRHLARALRAQGFDVYHVQTVDDNRDRIAQAVSHSLARADVAVVAGGLGPTGDDVTREAVADALGVRLEYRQDLWQQIVERFAAYGTQPTDNNERQAYVPVGATVLMNPVGTAPCFAAEHGTSAVVVLPGVPDELEYMFRAEVVPYLARRFEMTGVTIVRTLHTAGVGESQIDDLIGDLELSNNPTVGLAAYPGQVDIRLTAKSGSEPDARELLDRMEQAIRERLGRRVFGIDDYSLARAALLAVQGRSERLVVAECGLGGELVGRASAQGHPFVRGAVLAGISESASLADAVAELMRDNEADCGLGAAVAFEIDGAVILLHASGPFGTRDREYMHGGHPDLAATRAANLALDMLRILSTPRG